LAHFAAGIQASDTMLKAAAVEMVLARLIWSGKYMVMVRGEVGAVQAAVSAGVSAGQFSVIDSFVIPNLHESVFPAIAVRHSGAMTSSPGIGADALRWLDGLHQRSAQPPSERTVPAQWASTPQTVRLFDGFDATSALPSAPFA